MKTQDCATRYPIFLVHGTLIRQFKKQPYWGRIPTRLSHCGATVYQSRQQEPDLFGEGVRRLRHELDLICRHGPHKKVNIIAHSMGGLQARALAHQHGCAARIASITTVATPHYGSRMAQWVLDKPAEIRDPLLQRLLDAEEIPHFLPLLCQLAPEAVAEFNHKHPDKDGILYQSIASVVQGPYSDPLLAAPNLLLEKLEGPNDGLVSAISAKWTNFKPLWRSHSPRGISHLDSMDYRQKPLSFGLPIPLHACPPSAVDIPGCYVGLVQELKERGL